MRKLLRVLAVADVLGVLPSTSRVEAHRGRHEPRRRIHAWSGGPRAGARSILATAGRNRMA